MRRLPALLSLLVLLAVACTPAATETPAPAATKTLPPMQGPEPPTAAPPARPVSLTPAEAEERLAGGGAILLDVRDSYEWTNPGHVAGATLIPLGQLARRVGELDPKKEIIVMCNNGSRSKSGLQILQNAGFAHLAELEGGIQAWIAQGLPVSREN